jgi:acyl-homoserine lactone synthase
LNTSIGAEFVSMIFTVNADNRIRFAADLLQMHRHRKAVFVDGLGWNIPVIDDFEIDRYDRDDTTYLLAKRDPYGPVLASARLLPTIQPHLMIDLFRAACRGHAPCGPSIWEVSRFCVSPSVSSRRERVHLFGEIVCGVMETALAHGIEQVTYSANTALLPLSLACGWKAQRLGPTLPDGADRLTAIIAEIDAAGLTNVRHRFGIDGEVTQHSSPGHVSTVLSKTGIEAEIDTPAPADAALGHRFAAPLAATQFSPA